MKKNIPIIIVALFVVVSLVLGVVALVNNNNTNKYIADVEAATMQQIKDTKADLSELVNRTRQEVEAEHAESVDALSNAVDRLRTTVGVQIDSITERVGVLESGLNLTKEELDAKINALKSSTEEADRNIGTIVANLATSSEEEDTRLAGVIAALQTSTDARNQELAATLAALTETVSANNTELAKAISDEATALQEALNTVKANLEAKIEEADAALQNAINGLENDVNDKVEVINGKIADINDDIAYINSAIVDINEELGDLNQTWVDFNGDEVQDVKAKGYADLAVTYYDFKAKEIPAIQLEVNALAPLTDAEQQYFNDVFEALNNKYPYEIRRVFEAGQAYVVLAKNAEVAEAQTVEYQTRINNYLNEVRIAIKKIKAKRTINALRGNSGDTWLSDPIALKFTDEGYEDPTKLIDLGSVEDVKYLPNVDLAEDHKAQDELDYYKKLVEKIDLIVYEAESYNGLLKTYDGVKTYVDTTKTSYNTSVEKAYNADKKYEFTPYYNKIADIASFDAYAAAITQAEEKGDVDLIIQEDNMKFDVTKATVKVLEAYGEKRDNLVFKAINDTDKDGTSNDPEKAILKDADELASFKTDVYAVLDLDTYKKQAMDLVDGVDLTKVLSDADYEKALTETFESFYSLKADEPTYKAAADGYDYDYEYYNQVLDLINIVYPDRDAIKTELGTALTFEYKDKFIAEFDVYNYAFVKSYDLKVAEGVDEKYATLKANAAKLTENLVGTKYYTDLDLTSNFEKAVNGALENTKKIAEDEQKVVKGQADDVTYIAECKAKPVENGYVLEDKEFDYFDWLIDYKYKYFTRYDEVNKKVKTQFSTTGSITQQVEVVDEVTGEASTQDVSVKNMADFMQTAADSSKNELTETATDYEYIINSMKTLNEVKIAKIKVDELIDTYNKEFQDQYKVEFANGEAKLAATVTAEDKEYYEGKFDITLSADDKYSDLLNKIAEKFKYVYVLPLSDMTDESMDAFKGMDNLKAFMEGVKDENGEYTKLPLETTTEVWKHLTSFGIAVSTDSDDYVSIKTALKNLVLE